jgi:hypothetical protein
VGVEGGALGSGHSCTEVKVYVQEMQKSRDFSLREETS